MKRPDRSSEVDLLFDLPLEKPDPHTAADDIADFDADFVEVQKPLVFESTSEPDPAGETKVPPFAGRSASEPPVSSRFLAAILDLGTVAAGVAVALAAAALLGARPHPAAWPPFVLFGLCFSFLYTVVPLAFWGKTPGMAYAGIVSRGKDGLPLTIPQTVLRWLGQMIVYAGAGLPALLALSGVSLSDLLSRSRVTIDDSPATQ